jgi:hypothetical protein
MQNRRGENLTQNTQNPRRPDAQRNFEYFEDDFGETKNLFRRLVGLGVILSTAPDGRLAYDAPAGALGADLLGSMRAHRDDLLGLVEAVEERAAIREYDGGLSRADAERLALVDVLGG